MIVPIVIDTSDLMSQFNISPADINTMLDNIAKQMAAEFAQQLEELAAQELHQTRARYIRNIQVIDSGKLSATVLLDFSKDPLVKMIEMGATPFDMKDGFLKSAKVKIGKKGGRYLTIPFRWATPKALGESEVFSAKMPTQIHQVVKKAPLSIPVSGGGMRSSGLSLKDIPTPYDEKQVRPTIQDDQGNDLFKAYQHKSSLYQGMVKQQDGVTGQNRYFSFRRVSENSDPDAFIHPGIQRYNLVQKALSQFNAATSVGNQLDIELNKLGLL